MDTNMLHALLEKGLDAMLKNIVKEFRDVNLREDKGTNGNTI